MSVKTDVYDYLIGSTKIQSYVADRIFHGAAQQDVELPYLVYQLIGAPRSYTHDGYSYTRSRVQITAYATTAAGGENLRLTVIEEMEKMHLSKSVDPIMQVNSIDYFGTEKNLYQIPTDFIIDHKESAPEVEEEV